MPIFTETLPQTTHTVNNVTLTDLLGVLPEVIPYAVNVWVANHLARYGQTSGDILFLTEDDEPSQDLKQYFKTLVAPLGVSANVYNTYRHQRYVAMRLYDKGQLILDKSTGAYLRLPSPVPPMPCLTIDEVLLKLPRSITNVRTIYLTGSLVKQGHSFNDADFLILEEVPFEELEDLRRLFFNALGWKVHVGTTVMSDREPVFLYKLYEGGLCLPLQK